MAKKITPNTKKCSKKRYVLISVLVLVLIAAGIGIYCMFSGGVESLSEEDKTKYNSTLTRQAWMTSRIQKDELLIIHSIEENTGGDTKIELFVYKLPAGGKSTDYYHMDTSQISADSGLVKVGTATCKLAGGKLESIYNLQVTYFV